MSSDRIRDITERILQEWGGYRRSYAEAQGGLHRMDRDLIEASDRVACRGPGHSDPVLANLVAADSLGLRFMASLDGRILEYPLVWLRIIVPRYVGIRDADAENGWRLAQFTEICGAVQLTDRDVRFCMKQVRQQLMWDVRSINKMDEIRRAAELRERMERERLEREQERRV